MNTFTAEGIARALLIARRRSVALAGLLALASLIAPEASARSEAARVFSVAPDEKATPIERWYVVEMLGTPAGFMRVKESTTPELITTESQQVLKLKQGGVELKVEMSSVSTETVEGRLRSIRTVQDIGGGPIINEMVFKEDHIENIVDANGERNVSKSPLPPGDYLSPGAADRLIKAHIREGKTAPIAVRTIFPGFGEGPVEIQRSTFVRTTIQLGGKQVDALATQMTVEGLPVTTTEYFDNSGELLGSDATIGGLKVSNRLSTKAAALGASRGVAPEILLQTLIVPTGEPIKSPRTTRRATLLLSVDDGRLDDLPSQGVQRFERVNEKSGRMTIDRSQTPAPANPEDATNPRYLESSAIISSADRQVASLLKQALQNATDDKPARAERLRRFVFDHISEKTFGVGFASAAEVANSKRGDCTEHAVLLAALLRADGIPARVATGLVYVDNLPGRDNGVFGFHAWAQALLEIDGKLRWIDLDAALSAEHASDATHFGVALSHLSDNTLVEAMTPVAPLLGTLKVHVEAIE
ncbi:MAG: transglutaminase-like domain-containing protein [Planctomycetota bacterium]|nr:transglutaminase-like domain-containing protein [Planctomycetota bacterium]